MGRPPLKKSGAMSSVERLRRHRRKLIRQKKLANPKLVAKRERRNARELALAGKILALPDKKYGVIYGDPEWRFEVWSRETGLDRAADNHFLTSVLEVIKSRPIKTIAADNCALFLWTTVPFENKAHEVMAAWGFEYKSQVIWDKGQQGTGYWFRNVHEILLFGTRGNVPAPAPGTQWQSVIHALPSKHSEKPDVFYELIESYFPNLPKIELNARRGRAGWDSWGLEAPDN
jgi:N6-adenosine-specific RNA methylase IME4